MLFSFIHIPVLKTEVYMSLSLHELCRSPAYSHIALGYGYSGMPCLSVQPLCAFPTLSWTGFVSICTRTNIHSKVHVIAVHCVCITPENMDFVMMWLNMYSQWIRLSPSIMQATWSSCENTLFLFYKIYSALWPFAYTEGTVRQ